MDSIRFIHTADIHLGSIPQVGGASLPADLGKMLEEGVFEGFRRVCSVAIEHDVDFMIIAGDLYDGDAKSVTAQEFFVKQCERLESAGIGIYVLAGNHDPLREKQELFTLPANVRFFSSKTPQIFEVLNRADAPIARLVGQSYERVAEGARLHLGYPVLPDDLWNIGVLHTQLEGEPSNYIPCSLGELKERTDLHYWALGHIHQHRVLHNESPLIAYPGTPQGRHFKELHRGGCLLVELNTAGKRLRHLPTAPIVYKRVQIKIDQEPHGGPETLPELEEQIAAAALDILAETPNNDPALQGYVVQWIIEGRSSIHNLIAKQQDEALDSLLAGLRSRFATETPFLWSDHVTFRTKPLINLEEVLEHSPVLAELDRVIEECRSDPELQKKLRDSLGLIWEGHEDEENYKEKDDFIFHLDDETLEHFLTAARQRILERLVEGRE